MAEERKPLTDFRLMRTENGGWIITVGRNEHILPETFAYSSDADMLAALPGLIGYTDPEAVLFVKRKYAGMKPGDSVLDDPR